MKFYGCWVSGNKSKVVVMPAEFDDTDLSEVSNWKEAHQNEEPKLPHGFVNWNDAVANMERRLNGEIECDPE